MSPKRVATASIVAGVLVAVTLSSVSTAAATGLTSKAVKKIAVKVVNQQAPSLSVAHATNASKAAEADHATTATSATNATNATNAGHANTATNATNATNAANAANADLLNGLTVDALFTFTYSYTLPTQAAVGFRNYGFPGLEAGKYLVTYNVGAGMTTAGAPLACALFPDGATARATSYGTVFGTLSRANSSSVAQMTTGSFLQCAATSGNFSLIPDDHSSVTFTRIDLLTELPASGRPD